MKLVRKKCIGDYRHYWVRIEGSVVEHGTTVFGITEGRREIAWDREIVLECARCELRVYVDSVIRTYLGVKSDNDWGT